MLGVNFSISEEVEHLELKSQVASEEVEELLAAEVEDLGGKLSMHCIIFYSNLGFLCTYVSIENFSISVEVEHLELKSQVDLVEALGEEGELLVVVEDLGGKIHYFLLVIINCASSIL